MPELVRCPNCIAPLRLDAGPIATCTYCGAQSRIDTPGVTVTVAPSIPGQTRLAETVSFVTPTITIPWLEKDATLPIHRTETLSTRTDDQDALDVNLVQGSQPIAQFKFPIQKRGPRGVPKLALTVRVATDGAMSITVAEPGTTNAIDRDQLRVRVV
jgi:molecular chaperone DnaK (HSP70)